LSDAQNGRVQYNATSSRPSSGRCRCSRP